MINKLADTSAQIRIRLSVLVVGLGGLFSVILALRGFQVTGFSG
jgi:hypothetical protein